jgi:hypothetical protein
MVEIDVVGYHLRDFEPCRDCGNPAGFTVITTDADESDDFDLCVNCMDSGHYEVRTDRIVDSLVKISNVFKESNKGVNKPD